MLRPAKRSEFAVLKIYSPASSTFRPPVTGVIRTTLCSFATGAAAIVPLLHIPPTIYLTLSVFTSLDTADNPVLLSHFASSAIICICRPLIPPFAFISSTANCAVFTIFSPNAARSPLKNVATPIFIGSFVAGTLCFPISA
ncbi:MAG: hypothetical protein ACD_81C00012G0001, partial [uncultured bacterium]